MAAAGAASALGCTLLLMLIGELGALLLLFEVGLEIDLADLRKVGRDAIMVAIVGVALPLVGGWGSSIALGIASPAALLIGGALAATSVGITANVFGELRMLNSTEARVVLGAAVTDDVVRDLGDDAGLIRATEFED